MAEYVKYRYTFEVSNEITKCSECPFADETYRGCNLYSNGCVDRYHYAEFDAGKPEWCKLKELIQNSNGSYDICKPSEPIWKNTKSREQWKVISEFPKYSVSNMLRVKNNETGLIKKLDQFGAVTLSTGTGHVKRGVYSLFLKAFKGFPDNGEHGCRAKIRVIETGEIFYGYRAVCEALGIPYEQNSNIYKAIYMPKYGGEKRKVKGFTFELVEEGA